MYGGRRLLQRVALAGVVAFASCSDADVGETPTVPMRVEARRTAPAAASEVTAVVLVTIDGVRWQEVFGGIDRALAANAQLPRGVVGDPRSLLPNLHRLFFEQGTVLGDPTLAGGVRASGPHFVSLPSYIELMTGSQSTCRQNDCKPTIDVTVSDEIAARGDWIDGSVAIFASWEVLGRVAAMDRGRVFVNAGRDAKDDAPPFPGGAAYRPDHGTMRVAVDHLLKHRPRFLWVALGDTDEWAHRGDYRGYLDALGAADRFVGELAAHLADMGDYGAGAVVLVTTDHGRDADFATHGGEGSGRVWLMARGRTIPRQGAVASREQRYLRDVAPTIRALLDLPSKSCAQCGAPIEELIDGVPSRPAGLGVCP